MYKACHIDRTLAENVFDDEVHILGRSAAIYFKDNLDCDSAVL